MIELQQMIERTYCLEALGSTATAFVTVHKGRQYLITAKHMVYAPHKQLLERETIRLYDSNGNVTIKQVKNVIVPPGDPQEGGLDVAVVALAGNIKYDHHHPEIARPEELRLSQTVVMPTAESWVDLNGSLGIFVRRGSIASFTSPERRTGSTGDFALDLTAYPGFSGSPVLIEGEDNKFKLAGVAARWNWRNAPYDGQLARDNAGLTGCFYMSHVINLIGDS